MIDILTAFNIPEKQIISSESSQAEKIGRLTDLQLDIIYKNRWFHLLVPKNLGGDEMALPEFARFMETSAAIDGSFAWNVNLGAGANMFAGFMDQHIASELFMSERSCVAGSGAVRGTAKRKDGGFVINGNWKYASGSAHATYFSLNAQLLDSDASEFASFLVPAAEVEVLNTWKVFGMKATSSCDFKVNDVWVPESYLFNLQAPSPTVNSALYRFPFMLLAEINMLVMASGLAIHFYELLENLAKDKVIADRNKRQRKLIDIEGFASTMNSVKSSFLDKRATTFSLLDTLWNEVKSGRTIPIEMETAFSKSITETVDATRKLVDTLYPFAGMSVVFEDNEISRVYRDFKVASQHALLTPAILI